MNAITEAKTLEEVVKAINAANAGEPVDILVVAIFEARKKWRLITLLSLRWTLATEHARAILRLTLISFLNPVPSLTILTHWKSQNHSMSNRGKLSAQASRKYI